MDFGFTTKYDLVCTSLAGRASQVWDKTRVLGGPVWYHPRVPDQQANQFVRLVVRIPVSLASKIDEARGNESVSQFVRNSIESTLAEKGLAPTQSEIQAPDRKGKGGPKRRKGV